ncbi:MAG TPA: hypothetical protein DCS93_35290 [Microscillaceae bacterium]|nr:hypothetical protein [Microscillaceae bacterium]
MNTPIRIELPTIFGMKTVNAYLFLEPTPTLVDCGEQTDKSWEVLQAALAEHQLQIQDLARVIITHAHVDHIGMAGKIASESPHTEIWVSEYAYNWAVNPQEMNNIRQQVMQEYMQLFPQFVNSPFQQMMVQLYKKASSTWGEIPKDRIRKFTLEEKLHLGNLDWEIIYAPGHCNHQTCFYQPDTRQLISADMLLSITPSPVIDVTLKPPYKREKSLHQMIESFHKFAAMDIDQVYPGHYEPFQNHREIIQKQLDRINMRKKQCLELIKTGVDDFFVLLTELYGKSFPIPAIPMLVGYLDLLAEERLITTNKTKQGLKYYVT